MSCFHIRLESAFNSEVILRSLFDSPGLGFDQHELIFGAVLLFSGHLESMIINQIANWINPCPEITEKPVTTFSMWIITCVDSLQLLFLDCRIKLELYMCSCWSTLWGLRSVVSTEDEDDHRLHLFTDATKSVCLELALPRLSLSAHIDSGQHKYG